MSESMKYGRLFWARVLRVRVSSRGWLSERADNGDPVALAEVCRRNRTRVYGHCLSRLSDSTIAEAAAQETLVRFLDTPAATVGDLRQRLLGLADDVCREVGPLIAPESVRVPASVDGSQAELWRTHQERSAALALGRMRPRYRTALILSKLFGMSSVGISRAFGTRTGTIDKTIASADKAFCRLYPEVSHLPVVCSYMFPLIYGQGSDGLTETQRSQLEAHLSACAHCRYEMRWADKQQLFATVLPLPAAAGTRIESAGLPAFVAALGPVFTANPHTKVPAVNRFSVRAGAGALALVAVAALPAAALVAEHPDADRGSPPHAAASLPVRSRDSSATVRSSDGASSDAHERPSKSSRRPKDEAPSDRTGRSSGSGTHARISTPMSVARIRISGAESSEESEPRHASDTAGTDPVVAPEEDGPSGNGEETGSGKDREKHERPEKPKPPQKPDRVEHGRAN